jgi:hypothetical protein
MTPFLSAARGLNREAHREQLRERREFRQLLEASRDALDRWRDEFEIVKFAAHDGLLGERAEDLDRSLKQRLEVAPPHVSGRAALLTILLDELELLVPADETRHASIAQ